MTLPDGVTVTEFQPHTLATVRIRMTGVGLMKPDYIQGLMQPFAAVFEYVYEPAPGEGAWTSHVWRCRRVDVAGHKVLKPGPNGELRVSEKVIGGANWFDFRDDVSKNEKMPQVIADMIEHYRPSGEVAIPAE